LTRSCAARRSAFVPTMRRYRALARPRAIRCTGSVTLRDETSQRTFTEPPSIARRIECDSGAATLGHTEVRAFPEPQNQARLRIIPHRREGAGPRRYAGQPPDERSTASRGAALGGAASSVPVWAPC